MQKNIKLIFLFNIYEYLYTKTKTHVFKPSKPQKNVLLNFPQSFFNETLKI